jgi:hypothetical protein
MLQTRLNLALVAALVFLSFLFGGVSVLAGTTGGLSGTVADAATDRPISGAKVTAASPSQIASTTTDAGGRYNFLDLAPDTYTVSVEAAGYQSTLQPGVTVVADNTRVLGLSAQKALRTIGSVTARSASSLVKPGITADVYSVNPATQAKVAAAGGGGNLDSAWSALSTVPGVSVAPGQNGYIGAGPSLSIRGGDYDQIGYQIDGIPVNRAFDNYPSGPTSSLGQQELQVYTGAPPAGATSEGISGYINQVIRTGTYPGFSSLDLAAGGPTFYHKLSFEFGGETANRRFSYYAGFGGYNQDYRVVDQFNSASTSQTYGTPYAVPCAGLSASVAPSCYTGGVNNNGFPLLGYQLSSGTSQVTDRDNVINFHYYIPHQDGTRDDLQALFVNDYLFTTFYSSTNDQGGAALLNALGIGVPFYIDGYDMHIKMGGFLPANYQSLTSTYYFPDTPAHAFQAPIQPTEEDGQGNAQAIEKIQYTKSLGSAGYARVFGYSYYSNWVNTGPNCSYAPANCGSSSDYELSAHTRGINFNIADQFNPKNLLQLGGEWTTSTVVRDNNTQMDNGLFPASGPGSVSTRTAVGILVDSSNPSNGVCYSPAGAPTPCFSSTTDLNGNAGYATIGEAVSGTIPAPPATTCGAGACQYLVIGNGQYATYNTVKPTFWGASLTDEFRPSPKLTINGGLRLDVYQYQGADTSGGTARQFFYNAYNTEMCLSSTTGLVVDKIADLGLPGIAAACPAGYSTANFQNPAGVITQTYPVFQPRLGATYSLDPNTVLRASYGRYAQPPNSAFEQYDFLQSEAPATLYGTYGFQQYGYTSPNHPIPPATSNNYDFSIEHEFPGQLSVKLTPFLRSTANQIEQFYLNRASNFVSGLNVGNQTSRGFEFELDKGDFARQGLSAKLAFAYTNSYIKYNVLSNGSTVLTPVVNAINQYNAYTKAGGGAPCYTTTGTADPACAAGSIANPYYNAPLQNVSQYTNTNSTYTPYDTIPAGIGLDTQQIGYPYVASLVLNEHLNKLSIAPIFQLFAGQRYGDPLATSGVDPATCTGVLAGSPTGDPRYSYGAPGGSPFDATTCGQLAGGIPNVVSRNFDGVGQYTEPALLLMHVQLSYEATKRLSITANLANIVNTCFGGSNEPWNVKGACAYTFPNGGLAGAIGNAYNPAYVPNTGQSLQPIGRYAYAPYWPQQPFNAFVTANFKL